MGRLGSEEPPSPDLKVETEKVRLRDVMDLVKALVKALQGERRGVESICRFWFLPRLKS